MDTHLCKARTFTGEWVHGYYVKGLDICGKGIHIIFDPTTVFYSHGETSGFKEIDPLTLSYCVDCHEIYIK